MLATENDGYLEYVLGCEHRRVRPTLSTSVTRNRERIRGAIVLGDRDRIAGLGDARYRIINDAFEGVRQMVFTNQSED